MASSEETLYIVIQSDFDQKIALLILYALMEFSFQVSNNKLWTFHCIYIEGLQAIISKFLLFFFLANGVDSGEMSHYIAFHLGLHCLYVFRSHEYKNA